MKLEENTLSALKIMIRSSELNYIEFISKREKYTTILPSKLGQECLGHKKFYFVGKYTTSPVPSHSKLRCLEVYSERDLSDADLVSSHITFSCEEVVLIP